MSGAIALPSAQSGARNGEWRFYGGDAGSTRYSPLDQINAANAKDLRIAWRWKADNFGASPDFNYQATPIMIGGVLYTTAGTRRDVVAIHAETGETLWMYRLDEGTRGQRAPVRAASGRGVAYWANGTDERILHVTPGYHLVGLNAKSLRVGLKGRFSIEDFQLRIADTFPHERFVLSRADFQGLFEQS